MAKVDTQSGAIIVQEKHLSLHWAIEKIPGEKKTSAAQVSSSETEESFKRE